MTTQAYTYGSKNQSKPERLAHWLFKTCGSWRNVLAFLLVAALTYISIRFNIELGRLNAVDDTSKELLPTGYALLDLAGLFLSGYIGIRSKSIVRKVIAWVWFAFLVCLSLWAAASFTLSVDSRLENAELTHAIEAKKAEIETQKRKVALWEKNLEETTYYKTRYSNTLSTEQVKQAKLQEELGELEQEATPPAMAIYARVAPWFGLEVEFFSTIIKLLWAGALTLSPIVLMLLVTAEFILSHEPENAPVGGNTPDGSKKKKRGFTDWFHGSFKNKSPYKSHPHTTPATSAITPERVRLEAENPHDTGVLEESEGERVQEKKRTRRKPKSHPLTPSDQRDAGTEGKAKHRYEELKRQVIARKVRPSQSKIKEFCRCNQVVAERYQHALLSEGIIERQENGRYKVSDAMPKLRAVK